VVLELCVACHVMRGVLQVTKQNDMIQDLSIMKKGVDPSVKCVALDNPSPLFCCV
jgi:hypothetical protein